MATICDRAARRMIATRCHMYGPSPTPTHHLPNIYVFLHRRGWNRRSGPHLVEVVVVHLLISCAVDGGAVLASRIPNALVCLALLDGAYVIL